VPHDIDSSDALLAEIAAEADRLGLSYSGNPNKLSEPVDAIDAMLELFNIEPGSASQEKRLAEFPDITVEHTYTDIDDQPEDPEEWEMAQDTLNFFVYDLRNNPKDKDFESELRGFLSDEDYSYSAKTIARLLESALKNHR
jgi:hypothetical protein